MSDDKIIKTIRQYQMKEQSLSGVHKLMTVIACIIPLGLLFLMVNVITGGIKPFHKYIFIAAIAYLFCMFLVVQGIKGVKRKLKQFVGETVVREIIAERLTISKYEPNGSFDEDFLRTSGVLPSYSKSYGSDYIKGTYKGKQITYCDIKLESQKNDKTVTVFNGVVISLALDKPIGNKRVRILERGSKIGEAVTNAYINFWSKLGIALSEHTVKLESVEFNEKFEVQTTDDEFAFYILTPQFMENIIKIDRLAAARTNICFGNDHVNIALNGGHDAFEIGSSLQNVNQLEECRQKMRTDLNTVCLIMDEILSKERLFG
ncbi:MAG: DUF3137 domain-containing protein [Clostridium sp.]|nr:DUF3137 domain-containing protein [Clostridium sp.]MCM1172206.1 DUF3137 domain-containing protein [Clostridium sp.]MCM1208115.1 DUF3137 domain-containing protein [Ruminococcus sp.]